MSHSRRKRKPSALCIGKILYQVMRRGQVVTGGFFLAIAFSFFFMLAFEAVLWVCLLGNPEVYVSNMGGISYLSTCDEQLRILTNGFRMPALVIFLGLAIIGAWFLITGIESRSLITLKKQA